MEELVESKHPHLPEITNKYDLDRNMWKIVKSRVCRNVTMVSFAPGLELSLSTRGEAALAVLSGEVSTAFRVEDPFEIFATLGFGVPNFSVIFDCFLFLSCGSSGGDSSSSSDSRII